MPSVTLDKAEFARRVRRRFYDPAFKSVGQEIERIIDVAWDAYNDSRKSPITKPAGAGYADPTYELRSNGPKQARPSSKPSAGRNRSRRSRASC